MKDEKLEEKRKKRGVNFLAKIGLRFLEEFSKEMENSYRNSELNNFLTSREYFVIQCLTKGYYFKEIGLLIKRSEGRTRQIAEKAVEKIAYALFWSKNFKWY